MVGHWPDNGQTLRSSPPTPACSTRLRYAHARAHRLMRGSARPPVPTPVGFLAPAPLRPRPAFILLRLRARTRPRAPPRTNSCLGLLHLCRLRPCPGSPPPAASSCLDHAGSRSPPRTQLRLALRRLCGAAPPLAVSGSSASSCRLLSIGPRHAHPSGSPSELAAAQLRPPIAPLRGRPQVPLPARRLAQSAPTAHMPAPAGCSASPALPVSPCPSSFAAWPRYRSCRSVRHALHRPGPSRPAPTIASSDSTRASPQPLFPRPVASSSTLPLLRSRPATHGSRSRPRLASSAPRLAIAAIYRVCACRPLPGLAPPILMSEPPRSHPAYPPRPVESARTHTHWPSLPPDPVR